MEIILALFIGSLIYRAIPNVNVIPDLPWADDLTNDKDLGNTDDKGFGNYARMKFLETHPPAAPATLKTVPQEKFFRNSPKLCG